MVGGGGTSLAVVVAWLSKDAWFAIVDTFLFPATKALSDPSGATIHDGMATEAKHTKMMVIVRLVLGAGGVLMPLTPSPFPTFGCSTLTTRTNEQRETNHHMSKNYNDNKCITT